MRGRKFLYYGRWNSLLDLIQNKRKQKKKLKICNVNHGIHKKGVVGLLWTVMSMCRCNKDYSEESNNS